MLCLLSRQIFVYYKTITFPIFIEAILFFDQNSIGKNGCGGIFGSSLAKLFKIFLRFCRILENSPLDFSGIPYPDHNCVHFEYSF